MSTAGSRMSYGLAKGLGVKLEHNTPQVNSNLNELDIDIYIERDPTPSNWLKEISPNGTQILDYFHNLLPFLRWIGRYNRQYLSGDIIAGITLGAVIVPESTAYARLAGLSPEFGLYTAFIGSLTYWIFATSKDISIGPIAVISVVTGNILSVAAQTHPEIPRHVVASALALVAGVIVSGLGILRLGFLVDLIPLPSIYAFMSGAALTIGTGQLPSLLGIPHNPSQNNEPFINTGDPTYLVFIDTLKRLNEAQLDAALGLSALAALYAIRYVANQASNRFSSYRKVFFFLSTLRITFVILLYTMVSWLVNRSRRDDPIFTILGTIPRGFQHLGIPVINSSIIKSFASKLPVVVIVILLEHIASAKSFGRINNYTINPSQELLAGGVANIFGAFFGGFPVTGSFSRTAINSKAGIRTPMGGVVVALIVVLSIYALTAVFFYFPTSVLSAVIIHAVGDLITFPDETYRIWRISPIDSIIFITGVMLSIFTSIEIGIYVTVSVSAGVLGFRLMKSPGRFLRKVKIRSIADPNYIPRQCRPLPNLSLTALHQEEVNDGLDEMSERNLFLPMDHEDGTNPELKVEIPLPGIFIYRFSESFTYLNASHNVDQILQTVYLQTQRTDPNTYKCPGDQPWNAPSPLSSSPSDGNSKPNLKSIILDFSAVNDVDFTSMSSLHDLRKQLDHYAFPDRVSWHFANINNPWTKKALTAVGFGCDRDKEFGAEKAADGERRLRPIYDISNIEEDELLGKETLGDIEVRSKHEKEAVSEKIERDSEASSENGAERVANAASIITTDTLTTEQIETSPKCNGGTRKRWRRGVMISGSERPNFHVDLTSALQSAMAKVRYKETESDTGVLP